MTGILHRQGTAAGFIIRDRTDGEPEVAVILADGDNDNDYRTYHLGPVEIETVVRAMTDSRGREEHLSSTGYRRHARPKRTSHRFVRAESVEAMG